VGRRGPPKKPTVIRLAQGNPGRLRINTREPKPAKGTPEMPDWLAADAEAARCWKDIIQLLEPTGVLTPVDGHVLGIYCNLYSFYKENIEWLKQHGVDPAKQTRITLPKKRQTESCFSTNQERQSRLGLDLKYVKQLRQLAAEFGLTPVGRAGIRIPHERPVTDEIDKLYFGQSEPAGEEEPS